VVKHLPSKLKVLSLKPQNKKKRREVGGSMAPLAMKKQIYMQNLTTISEVDTQGSELESDLLNVTQSVSSRTRT
jgi:hypothetical protein